MKTHVLLISNNFPKGHINAGENTYFVDKIKQGSKIHTIRNNYDFWKSKINDVNEGKAILSVRSWTGKPYASKQQEHFRFTKADGVGIQKIELQSLCYWIEWDYPHPLYLENPGFMNFSIDIVAKCDGLTPGQFRDWFGLDAEGYKSEPKALIHFTKERYK